LPVEDNNGAVSPTKLVLSFFQEKGFHVQIDSQSISSDNIYSFGGHQDGRSVSTFTITITDAAYLITLQDIDSGLTYRVTGNTSTGIGQAKEIDLRLLPSVYDSAPIAPPVR